MNKKGLIILIVFLSIACVVMSGGFIYLLTSNFEWGCFNFSNASLVETISYENDATSLIVDTKSIDVFFEESESDKFVLEVYSNNKNIDYSFNDEDGVIYLKAHNSKNVSLFGFYRESKVVVKIPKENNLEEFKIDAKVGDIKIANFENLNGTIINTVGDLNITSLNNVKIELGTGDIDINKINKVDIKHTTGDLDIDTVSELINNSSTGDIKIENIDSKFEITSTTGDIRITNAELNNNSLIDHKTGDIRIKKISGAYIEASSKVGDTKINNNDRYSEYTLTIKNNTGDIKIN